MKVGFLTAEVYPFSKVGGLADVAGSLPIFLKNKGIQIIILSPFYSRFKREIEINPVEKIKYKINFNLRDYEIEWLKIIHKDVEFYLLKYEDFYGRDYIYVPPSGEDELQYLRFAFFSFCSLDLFKKINFKPDILHINDWHTSFIPIYLKEIFKDDEFYKNTKVLLSIHNLSYQGIYEKEILKEINLKEEIFDKLSHFNKINFLKGGIIFSDYINTVSPSYAKEILTPEFGCGLEEVLKSKREKILGILNGIDYEEFNPEKDKEIYENFNLENFKEGKRKNKIELKKNLGFENKERLLIGMVSRLTYQKGIDFLIEVMDEFLKRELDFVLLATGEKKYEDALNNLERKYKDKFKFIPKFDQKLAKKIYAGSDVFLIPSRFEPCGLTQMISMRYGTIPFGYKTGGLKDTIKDFEEEGWGFVFDKYEKDSFLKKLDKIIKLYYEDKKSWEDLIIKCMKKDFSWLSSAEEYIKLYRKML